MSERKLSRLAGLVLALAVVFGGAAVAGAPESTDAAVPVSTTVIIDWD